MKRNSLPVDIALFRQNDRCEPRWLGCLLLACIGWAFVPSVATAQKDAGVSPDTAVATDQEESEADLKNSSPEALIAYSDAASYQNNGAFDLAVEAWQEFLKEYGDDPKSVDASYNLGVCQLQLKQFEEAAETLKQVIEEHPEFNRIQDAYLNAGWAMYSAALNEKPERFKDAYALFAGLVKKFPDGKYRDQALFFQGESLYMQGLRDEAVKAYAAVVDDFKESKLRSDAMYALGVSQEELGQFEEAGKIYDRFIEEFPEHDLVDEVRMRRAETLLRSGNAEEAEKRFAEVAQKADFPSADHATYRQAFCLAELQKFAEAGELFAKLVRDFPNSRYQNQATMAAGRSFFRANQLDKAAEWFDKVIAAGSPFKPEAVHWRARILLANKLPQRALDLLEAHREVPKDNPFYVNLLMDRADALYELDDKKPDALKEYLAIAKNYSDHALAPHALYNAAFAAMELKKPEVGLELAQRFIAKHADHPLLPDVKQVAAECSLQLGDNSKAAELFSDVSKATPDNPNNPVAIRQALAMYLKKDYTGAIATLEAKKDGFKDPVHQAEAHYLLGLSYLGQDNAEKAISELQAALTAKKDFAQADEALVSLADAYRQLGQTDEAIATLRKMIAELPGSSIIDKAYYRLGEYEFERGNFTAAIDAYSQVIASQANEELVPYAIYGRGWAELRALNLDDAIQSFSLVLKDFPNHKLAPKSRYARAMAYQQNREFEKGLVDIDLYLKSDLSNQEKADALYVKGLCQAGLSQFEEAVTTFTTILREMPDYEGMDKVLYELGWAYKNLDRQADAVAVFKRLATQFKESDLAAEALYHTGEKSYQDGDFKTAAVSYARARELVGNNEELGEKVLYKLGWSNFQAGDYLAARDAFEQQRTKYPNGKLAHDAAFMIAECFFKEGNYEEAFKAFEQLRDKPLSTEQLKVLTLLHGGQSASQLKKWATSISWLNDIRRKYPDTRYLPTVLYEQAWALQNLGKLNDAMKLYAEVTKKSRSSVGARARFMMGEILYANRQYENAIKEFQRVMYGYGAEKAPAAVKNWQAKAGFEAGQCAGLLAAQQNNRNERRRYVNAAKKFFEYVRDQHPNTKEAAAAIEQLKKYQQP